MSTTLHRIQRSAKYHRVTLDKIAREAGVTRQHVSHVLNGKFKSRRVVEITKRLIAEHKADVAARAGTAA